MKRMSCVALICAAVVVPGFARGQEQMLGVREGRGGIKGAVGMADVPEWVLNPPTAEDVVYSVGGAKEANEFLAILTAEERALQNLPRFPLVLQVDGGRFFGAEVEERYRAADGTWWVLMSMLIGTAAEEVEKDREAVRQTMVMNLLPDGQWEDVPEWVLNPPIAEDALYGIGGAHLADTPLAIQAAEDQARNFLRFRSYNLSYDWSGNRVVRREQTKDGTWWVLMSLPNATAAMETALEEAQRAQAKANARYAEFKAQQALEEMDRYLSKDLIKQGREHIDADEYDQAIECFNEAVEMYPDDASIYFYRALAYHYKEDYDRAIADYTEAIRINPDGAGAYNNRGNIYYDEEDYDRAIADYTEAIRIDPDDILAYNNRIRAYSKKGDYERVIADSSELIRIDPDDADAYNSRGWNYYLKGEYQQALEDANWSITIRPTHYALDTRASAYQGLGNLDEAIADWEASLRLNPDEASKVLYEERLKKARQARGQ